jgi:hypothetical protein
VELEEGVRTLRAIVGELKDRQDILDCITRECRGRDRQDVEMTLGAYWPDGVDEHGPVITPAPDYPARANAGHAAGFSATSHSLTNHHCEIEGDTASCETYVVGGLLAKDGKTCIIAPGRYLDKLERRNGEWRIVVRRTIVDMCLQGDSSWLATPALTGFLKGRWDRSDPAYQRPIVAGTPGATWS